MQPDVVATMPPCSAENALLSELEQRVGSRSFDHWFRRKTVLAVRADELVVGVGSPFLLSWMQRQFRSHVAAAAHAVLGPYARIRFEVDASVSVGRGKSQEAARDQAGGQSQQPGLELPAVDRPAVVLTAGAAEAGPPGRGRAAEHGPCPAAPAPRAGRRFADLADFIEGRCNELALTAARQICDAPGSRYNPLFLHGGVGIGKTHLLEGIYRRLRRRFPSLHVMFLTAEAFANYFTEALRDRTLPAFRQKFRGVDVLLVDDVDFFDGKRAIQEEFLHTFKQLESHQRQIVLTCDRHPRLLSKVGDELTTRFVSGLVCRLEPPDLETREKIVAARAGRMRADFAPEALSFVAQRFRNNVRELEGALHCLATYHSMTGKRVGLSAARRVLADLERDCIRIVRISDVEQAVCRFFGLAPEDLKSPGRQRSVSQPRMLAMFLARKHTQAAYSEIGQYFGGRNHSTVMSAERKIKGWLEEHVPIRVASQSWTVDEVIETLEEQLRAG